MTPNDWTENADENNENAEQDRLKKDNLKHKFLKNFVEFNYKNNWTSFFNEISKAWSLTAKLKKNLLDHQRGISEFDWVDVDSIEYSQITSQITSIWVSIYNKRTQLRDKILKEYDVSDQSYLNNISKSVEELDIKDIDTFNNSDLETWKFLKSLYWEDSMPARTNLLKKIEWFNLKDRYSKLNEDAKWVVDRFHNKLENAYSFSAIDFRELFAVGVFSDDEKVNLIKTLVSSITLQEAIDINLVSRWRSEDYKQQALEGFLKEIWQSATDASAISWALNPNDIIISTDKLISSPRDALRIISKTTATSNMSDELNRLVSHVNDKQWQSLLEGIDLNSITPEQRQNIFKDFDLYKGLLSKTNKLSWTTQIETGSILVLDVIREKWETEKMFFEIADDWSDRLDGASEWKMQLFNRSRNWAYSWDVNQSETIYSYSQLFDFIHKGNESLGIKVNSWLILSQSEMKKNIDDGVYDEVETDLKQKTDSEINSKVEELEQEKKLKTQQLKRDWLGDNQISQHIDILDLDDKIKNTLWYNEIKLIEEINKLDSWGTQFGFERNTTFATDDWFYTVLWIDSWIVTISSLASKTWIEEPTFEEFVETFKAKSAKRISKANSFENVLESIWSEDKLKENFKGFWIKGWKIKSNDKDAQGFEYNYLVAEKWKNLFQLWDIEWDKIWIYPWEYYEENDEDEKTKQKTKKKFFNVDNKQRYLISFGHLEWLIKKHKLKPRSLDEEKDIEKWDDKIDKVDRKWHFFSKIFSNLSLTEVMMGWKMWLENFESFLKEWNDEHAALFASKLPLPKELQSDMQARIDQAQSKRMDDNLAKLKEWMDSWPATELIAKWLQNKNCPEYKKEAGLKYMMENYWVLYNKKWLKDYRWSFLWFKALANYDGDVEKHPLYIEVQQKCEDEWTPFNEEELVYILLVLQCKPEWFKWVKRRGRLHKEYKKIRTAIWPKEEYDKWDDDSKDVRSVGSQIKSWLNELGDGTYGNAIWWLKWVWNLGWTMKEMHTLPFVMAFSWAWYQMDDAYRVMLKNLYDGEHYTMPLLRMFVSNAKLDVLNKTIVSLSRQINNRKPWLFPDIYNDALAVFKNQKDNTVKHPKKVKAATEFFEKYGDVLMNSLYWLNTQSTDEESELNNILDFDTLWNEKEKHEDHENFHAFHHIVHQDLSNHHVSDDWMNDGGNMAWLSWLWDHVLAPLLDQKQGWGYNNKHAWPTMRDEIYKGFDAIRSRWNTQEEKTIATQKLLKSVLAALFWNHASRPEILSQFEQPTSDFYFLKEKWWISMSDMKQKGFNKEKILAYDTTVRSTLDKYVSNILSNTGWWSSAWISEDVITWTKKASEDVITWTNESDY